MAGTYDACPTHYSGELGAGEGGVWLFARETAGTDGGDGVVACYGGDPATDGPTTGHHGADTTIAVRDDVLGGAIAFTVTRDYNRSADNLFLPAHNQDTASPGNGSGDCGDNIVEPCGDDPAEPTTPPGCNPLDASAFNFPADGLCEGLSSLGNLLAPDVDPPTDLVSLVTNFLVSLLGLTNGGATCALPAENAWTVPNSGTLADFAGADGAVVVFIESNVRADAGHSGTGSSGAVWTEGALVGNGHCAPSPGLDGHLFTCTYNKGGCTWVYRSHHFRPHKPHKNPGSRDWIVTKTCA